MVSGPTERHMAEYEPGQCNIGTRERRKRRLVGIATLIGGAAYAVAVIAVAWPPEALLATYPFAVGGVLGVLQSREAFCAGFAIAERFDLSNEGGDAGRVRNAAAVKRDRLRAGKLVLRSMAWGALFTAVVYVAAIVGYSQGVLPP
jgi:hypothetical protein